MIRFEHVWALWLLPLTVIWAVGTVFLLRIRSRDAERFVSAGVFDRIAGSFSVGKLKAKSILWLIAWTLLIAGLANPQVGTRLEEVKREGIDIVIALDVSNSMRCEDFQPSRMEAAKHEIQKFVSGLRGDRVGLVVFAGTAIIHCPMTTDYGAVKLLTRIISTDLISEQGTALAGAIEASQRCFSDENVKSKVLVIITDGEDQEEGAVEAAQKAADAGIRIYTIGLGTPQGAPIPELDSKGNPSGFKRDRSGQVVMTRLNDLLLKRVADAGAGLYLPGTRSGQELEAVWDDISRMEKRSLGQMQFTSYEDRFQYFVFPAMLLILAEFLLSEKRGFVLQRWLRKRRNRQRANAESLT